MNKQELKILLDLAHRKHGPKSAAFLRAALDPKQQSTAAVFAVDYLKQHGLTPSTSKLSSKVQFDLDHAFTLAQSAALAFVATPNRRTHSHWVKSSVALANVALHASDKHRAKLPTLDPVAELPPAIEPALSRAPATALEWQTHPSIGANPMHITMLRQTPKSERQFLTSDDREYLRSMVKYLTTIKPVSSTPRPKSARVQSAPVAEIRPHCVTLAPKLSLRKQA